MMTITVQNLQNISSLFRATMGGRPYDCDFLILLRFPAGPGPIPARDVPTIAFFYFVEVSRRGRVPSRPAMSQRFGRPWEVAPTVVFFYFVEVSRRAGSHSGP